jgi:predicted dehydrogenase
LALANGSTLAMLGKASSTNAQTFNGLTVGTGANAITLTANATANPLSLSVGAITTTVGGTLDVTLPAGTASATNGFNTSTAVTNGILGGYATANAGAGWLVSNATGSAVLAGETALLATGSVGTTTKDDHNTWTLNGAIRLRDWSFAERLGPDGAWAQAPDALPNEKMRPMVLRGQLAEVAAMTRGEAHRLATLREALEVQEIVEAILAA